MLYSFSVIRYFQEFDNYGLSDSGQMMVGGRLRAGAIDILQVHDDNRIVTDTKGGTLNRQSALIGKL